MVKHIDIQNKNILIKTKYYQQSVSNDACIKKEAEDNNECTEEEFTDFGYNIEKNKHNNSSFRIVKRKTEIINESDTTIKTENDVTIFNGCTFTSEIKQLKNYNNRHLIAGRQLNNSEEEYQCKICDRRFSDNYNLKVHKSLHANIKKFKCTTCCEQFLEFNDLKSHMISHMDNNMELLKKQLLQEWNDDGECNSNLCNKINMLDGLKTSHSGGGVPIENRTIHKVTLEFSVEIEYPKSYECAKCHTLFHDRPSIIDHFKPCTDKCINCCKYIGNQTSCKYPISFQPETPAYFECDECYNEFYTLKSYAKYLSAQSIKEKDRPYKCDVCLKTYIHLHHFAAHQRLHRGERPYQCKICNKRFHASFNLEGHMFLHQNIKRFKCNLCSKEFLKSTYLKIHKLSHSSNIHKCNRCDKEFESLNSLQKHKQLHSRNKPHKKYHQIKTFGCHTCQKKCTHKSDIRRHMDIHN